MEPNFDNIKKYSLFMMVLIVYSIFIIYLILQIVVSFKKRENLNITQILEYTKTFEKMLNVSKK
jgi:hypothetical protein